MLVIKPSFLLAGTAVFFINRPLAIRGKLERKETKQPKAKSDKQGRSKFLQGSCDFLAEGEKKMFSRILMSIIVVLALASGGAVATPVSVGTGVNDAGVYIEWSDGFIGEFEVWFGQSSSDTITGADLLLTLHSELTDFTLAYTNWGTAEEPDLFVDSMAYLGHSNGGYGGGDDWWHYWLKDAGETSWTSPLYGMSSRVVGDGDMDGWIYGRSGAPVPEPATVALLAGGVILLRRRRYG